MDEYKNQLIVLSFRNCDADETTQVRRLGDFDKELHEDISINVCPSDFEPIIWTFSIDNPNAMHGQKHDILLLFDNYQEYAIFKIVKE